jgi:DNA mismatch endonuclease (patch repair protein)
MKKPQTNIQYWEEKLQRNRTRDAANRAKLRILGWKSLVVWECELRTTESVERRLRRFLD